MGSARPSHRPASLGEDRYGAKIDRWIVVNEPLDIVGGLDPENHFLQVLGPGYVAEAFGMADEIWPEAQLVLNQDLVEYLPARADGLVELAAELVDDGVPVDSIGLQGHLLLGEPSWAVLEDVMDRFARLGLPIGFTEIDVPLTPVTKDKRFTVQTQASLAARLVRTCLDEPRCRSVTFWGFDDGDTWLDTFIEPGTDPLLYDAHLQPKPMYFAVRDELRAVAVETEPRARLRNDGWIKRVAVIGCIGAGKSTLARALGEILGLPVVHLDRLWWQDGHYRITGPETVMSRTMDSDAFRQRQRELAREEAWIIDGGYIPDLDIRLARADTVVFLDLPRRVCLWRLLKRHNRRRSDYPEGVREGLGWARLLITWIWAYPSKKRPEIQRAIAEHCNADTDVIRLRTRKHLDKFLADVDASHARR